MTIREVLRAAFLSTVLLSLLSVAARIAYAQSADAASSCVPGGAMECGGNMAVAAPDTDAVGAAANALGGGSGVEGASPAVAANNVSPAQLDQARQLVSGGGGSPEQMQRLCAGVAAKHMSAQDIDSMAASMGISGEQVAELKNCTEGKAGSTTSETGGANTPRSVRSKLHTQPTQSQAFSSVEASFRNLVAPSEQVVDPTPVNLRQFGYSLFSVPVSTFAPLDNVPIESDYILGPGDGLNILMWGRVNRTLHVAVERNGSILIPEIGPIDVGGLTFEQTKKLIESRAEQITGVQVDVTMGSIRTIQVFVIGKVNRPGLFTVSALSHVSNALVAAGGINRIGSLRRVELRRHNQLVQVVDLYDMLLHGNTASDVRVEQGDVLFVPVIGSVVGVTGGVKDPAIYELKGSEDLEAVLRMAGGVGPFGYSQRLQVERVSNHERRIVLDIDLARIGAKRFVVRDGDLLKVFTVLPERQNVVTLKGNVHRPGLYQWHPGIRVSGLVTEGEEVADHTFFGYALIRRVEGPDRRLRFLPVDLGAALAEPALPAVDVLLEPRDELTIYDEKDIADLPKVSAAGAFRRPGSYPLTEEMHASDLIYEAGGLKDNAYLNRAELVRTRIVNGTADYVYQQLDLNQVLATTPGTDPILRRGDRIVVQEASNWHEPWTVTVNGEAMRSGPYVIFEGERLDSLLEQCGGLRFDAYLPATVFIRRAVKRQEQERLDESRRHLQADAARLSLMPRKAGAADNSAQSLALVQQVLADTQSEQAVGRIVLHLDSLAALPRSQNNLVLQDGDSITIPKQPATVAVLGQVFNPSAIIFQPGRTVGEYLQKAGGSTQWADEDHILLIRANGEVTTDQSARHSGKNALFPILPALSGGLMGVELKPGDTIFVPENLEHVSGLRYATDITQIIANSAMGLAVLGILGSSL